MSFNTSLPLAAAFIAVSGCARPIATAPYPISPTAAVERNDLEVPADLEIRSASYSVTSLPDVTGVHGNTNSSVQVWPYLTVYAVRRSTGEQLLLIYEDLAQRKQPSQIIRLVQESRSAPPA
jgi:hypothetical protein